MTAYLHPGDKIMLAAPDVMPGNSASEDAAYWRSVYGPLGVHVHHVAVDERLTHPVVIAVFRAEQPDLIGELARDFARLDDTGVRERDTEQIVDGLGQVVREVDV